MKSFWSEPYLWIHVAGLAAFPVCLGIGLLGLAVGDPVLPVWMELWVLAIAAIVPVLVMQLLRPFNIFGILFFSLKPELLTPEQRKILSFFKQPTQKIIAIAAALLLVVILWQIYQWSPSAASVTPLPPQWRLLGLAIAAGAFFAAHLFLQVPLAVSRVLLTQEAIFAATEPYPVEKIRQDFTNPGFKVNQIVPPLVDH